MSDENTLPAVCPTCAGTGLNNRGGPCRYCHATGLVSTKAEAFASGMNALGSGLIRTFWSLVALAILVVVIVGALHS